MAQFLKYIVKSLAILKAMITHSFCSMATPYKKPAQAEIRALRIRMGSVSANIQRALNSMSHLRSQENTHPSKNNFETDMDYIRGLLNTEIPCMQSSLDEVLADYLKKCMQIKTLEVENRQLCDNVSDLQSNLTNMQKELAEERSLDDSLMVCSQQAEGKPDEEAEDKVDFSEALDILTQ